MKIAIVGAIHGDFSIFNKVEKETDCDLILCTGELGVFYMKDRLATAKWGYGDFWKYLSGNLKFKCPIIAVPGNKENYILIDKIISGDITIHNFKILGQGEKTVFKCPNGAIGITGIGGTYSPKRFKIPNSIKNKKPSGRMNFNFEDVENFKNHYETNILLMHELVGELIGKDIKFSFDQIEIFEKTFALACFMGRYEKWFHCSYPSGIKDLEIISLPVAQTDYAILDTAAWSLKNVKSIFEKGDDSGLK